MQDPSDAVKTGDDVNHLPPSPTPIPQLDGDAPDDTIPNPNPDLDLNDDAPDNNDDDTVFNAINYQYTIEECSNEMCYNLNYYDESKKKHIKDLKLHQLQKFEEMSKTLSSSNQ